MPSLAKIAYSVAVWSLTAVIVAGGSWILLDNYIFVTAMDGRFRPDRCPVCGDAMVIGASHPDTLKCTRCEIARKGISKEFRPR